MKKTLGFLLLSILLTTPALGQEEEEGNNIENAESGTETPAAPPSGMIYKAVDKDGQPVYTDKPHKYLESELIQVQPGINTLPSQTDPEVLDKKIKTAIEERKERNESNTARWERKKEKLQAAFENAKKARETGQDTVEGDFIGYRTKTGGQACCRPSQQRQERLKKLDDNLLKSREELRRHLRKNPKTYTE